MNSPPPPPPQRPILSPPKVLNILSESPCILHPSQVSKYCNQLQIARLIVTRLTSYQPDRITMVSKTFTVLPEHAQLPLLRTFINGYKTHVGVHAVLSLSSACLFIPAPINYQVIWCLQSVILFWQFSKMKVSLYCMRLRRIYKCCYA
jgi:hypothetical protein